MIYVDMDGVVADFEQAIINVFGEEYSDRVADKFWKKTCVEAEVFRKMPPILEGIEMVASLKNIDQVCFMTSTGGMPHHIDIAKQKLDWLHANKLGGFPVAFCMNTKGKGLFAQYGAVLIDDREKVCAEWERKLGRSILFTREKAALIPKMISYQVTTTALQ
jgi:hypothetical protein